MNFPYHPAYGLPDTFRQTVVTYARATSVALAAARFNVGQSTVYRWLAAIKETN